MTRSWACLVLVGCGRLGFGNAGPDAGTHVPAELAVPAFSTTSTEFVDVPGATLEIPPSPGTRWLLVTSAGLASTTPLDVNVEARYLVDGVERGVGGVQATSGLGPWQHVFLIEGTAAAQTVVYQLRDASAATATIDQLHVVALPLPADADVHYASADDPAPVTATTLAPAASLSLGALDGDYVVLAVVNATDLPDLSDVYVEWRGPGGEVLLDEAQQPREPWQSFFAARVLSISSADAVVTLNARVGSGTSQLRYMRVVAIRTDAFASIDQQLATTPLDTQSATVSLGNELTVAGTAPAYFYLASASVEEVCGVTPDAARMLHFFVDDDDHAITHATDNCAAQNTYGAVGLLAQRPSRLAIGVSSGNGEHVILGDSQLLLLGLP